MRFLVKLFKKFDIWIDNTSRLLMTVSGLSTLAMGLLTTYAVVQRYIFRQPSDIAYETSMMLLVLCAIAAIPAVERTGQNIRVDFVVNFMPKIVQIILIRVTGPILGMFYGSVLVWKGWTAALYSIKIQEVSNTMWAQPLYPIKTLIPIAYMFFMIVLIAQLIQGIIAVRKEMAKPVTAPGKGALHTTDTV